MRYDRFAVTKEQCCQCADPYEISTERDFCQRCKTSIWEPTWGEHFQNRLKSILEENGVFGGARKALQRIVGEKLKYINSESDVERARLCLSQLEKDLK